MSTRSANRPVIEADLEQVERQLQYFGQGLRIASADGAVAGGAVSSS